MTGPGALDERRAGARRAPGPRLPNVRLPGLRLPGIPALRRLRGGIGRSWASGASTLAIAGTTVAMLLTARQVQHGWEQRRDAAAHSLRDRLTTAAVMIGSGAAAMADLEVRTFLAPALSGSVPRGGERMSLEAFARSGDTHVPLADPDAPPAPRGYLRVADDPRRPGRRLVEALAVLARDSAYARVVLGAARPAVDNLFAGRTRLAVRHPAVRGTPVVVALAAERDGEGRPVAVFGVTYPIAAVLRRHALHVLRGAPALPATFEGIDWHTARPVAGDDRADGARRAVTGAAFGAPPDDVARGIARNRLLAVRLRRASGTLVELRGDAPASVWDSPFVGTTYVDGPGGRLAVDVALPRALGDRLVTAATPLARERLVLAGVLTLGGLFAAAAALGLRRERQLTRARSLFLATVSHELRTPIAHVTALSETMLLGRAESPEQARRWLRVIHREGQRLGALTANVLLHARGEHRGISVTPQRTDLAPWADDVAGLVAATAEARGARVVVDAAPVAVWVDPALLRHAVLNLLDNALKFGPDGQTVRLSARVAPDGTLVVAVDDEGRGVPPADRARIWRPFVRLSDGGDSPGGTGLGLDVVRRVTEQLGGSVEVGDAPGGGARFTLRLPRAGHRPAGDAATAPHAAV